MTQADYHGGNPEVLYASEDRKRVTDLFGIQVGFMMFMAQIPLKLQNYLPRTLSSLGWLLARCYCVFVIFQTGHLAVLFVKTTYDMMFSGELEEITDAMTMAIIYSFSCFATCYWLWRAKPLEEFLERINRKYRHHSMAGLTFVSAYPAYAKARKITTYWQLCCISGVVLWGCAPIILGSRTLPLKCWYPFDPMKPFVYEIMYTLQLLGQINVGTTFGNGSALFVSLAIVMLGQFDVLFCSLKNFDFHARYLIGEDLPALSGIEMPIPLGQDDELNQYLFSEEHRTDLGIFQRHVRAKNFQQAPKALKQALHESLVECVKLHRFILQSCDTLEELFNPYCLIKSLQITLQLCLLAFVGVAGERSTMRTINLIQYLALTLSELLMFTYCGELLRSHSIRCGEAFGRSRWWTNASCIRQDILIFLVNSKRVVKITAGKFYWMDVERLRSVVTQAFSFLTLLQKIAAKK